MHKHPIPYNLYKGLIGLMSKLKPQYGLQEELLIMIYRLIEKKTSKIFREPVDRMAIPDYYEKIKNPIDISTIIKKLKNMQYKVAQEVKLQFELMMANCRLFNMQMEVLRLADKFQKSIETEWGNFEKQIKRKGFNILKPIAISQQTVKNFEIIEDKNINRKPSNLQTVLSELQTNNKKAVAEYRILPPLPQELFHGDKAEHQLPKQFNYQPVKYINLTQFQKQSMVQFSIDHSQIANIFQVVSSKKITKYKKILFNKIDWIDSKIIKKCLQRKRFKKMATPQYLTSYVQGGDIANSLQLRKLQMYVKMVAYWIEEYPTILSYTMKNKFIDTCRAIKRCIFRVLRYRKIPKTTKVNANYLLNQNEINQELIESREQLGEEESRRYDNQIKSFKRMLSKDQGQTIKKFTKIQIKNENGQFTVVDWNIQNNDKKKTNRSSNQNRTQENTQETQRIEKERQKKDELERDEQFLLAYNKRNTVDIILSYHTSLWIDWDHIKIDHFETQSQDLHFPISL